MISFLCLAGSIIGAEMIAREFWSRRPAISYRTMAADALKRGNVDIVFVGSSHIYTGVDPSKFDQLVVNVADSALSYQLAETLCGKYWETIGAADVAVIELDAVPVYTDTLARWEGDLRGFYEWNLRADDLPLSPLEKLTTRVSEQFTVIQRKPLWPALLNEHQGVDKYTRPGFQPRTQQLNESHREAFFDALGTEFPMSVVARNLKSLETLIRRLTTSDVQVFMYRPPFHSDYWRHPSSQQREKYVERATDLIAANFPEIEIIDFRHKLRDQDESTVFSDWTHVSAKGASLVSNSLAKWISGHR